ncbi:MAG: hypothetical protein HFJ34_01375 [Clostridia bacterium]|nr:hypothetical protein [Clostridia bacterium]
MKKTLLGVVAITMLLVALLATSVNAASVTANKEGDIVTVTVTTNETVESMEFVVNFDSTNFEFVEGSIKSALSSIDSNMIGEGKLMVSAFGGEASTLTLQFRCDKNIGGAFTLSDTEFSNDETMSKPTAIITATEPTPVIPTPDDDKKPGEEVGKPTEGENNNQGNKTEENNSATEGNNTEETTEEYVDEEGKKITKIPQTGTYMPTVLLSVSVLGIAFMAGYKMIKNK